MAPPADAGTGAGSTVDGTWSEPIEASELEWRKRDPSRSPSARPECARFLGVHRAAVFVGTTRGRVLRFEVDET